MKFIERSLFLLALGAIPIAAETYHFTMDQESFPSVLRFPAPIRSSGIFRDARNALQLLEVKVDGSIVAPSRRESGTSAISQAIAPAKSGFAVYDLTIGHVEFCQGTRRTEGARIMTGFAVPDTARLIEIRYVIRYPDGSKSEPQEASYRQGSNSAFKLSPTASP